MTSAYEMTTEREQQKATSPYDTTRVRFNARELDNPDTVAEAEGDMEETSSSSRASFATGDSSFEESTLSSVEVSVLPAESFDGGLGMFEKENEDEDEERFVDASVNSVNDISRMSRNEESSKESLEDNERHKEEKESVLLADNTMPESASTCSARRERVKDQAKDLGKDQRNRSVLEIRVQERRVCDNGIHAGEKFRESALEDVRACCENVAKICLDTDEKQDEFEREIIGQQDDDSFYDAVRSGNAKRVSALIANGCVTNLDEPDWNVSGDPPLLMAATNHSLPVLR